MDSTTSNRSFRIMMVAQFGWLVLVCLMVGWWGRLLLRQAGRIAELEESLGLSVNLSQDHWHHVQRMLYWESLTFFALLLISSVFLFWLYWRDLKRAKGLHAFFASVTHELRTPLTSIRLQAESLAEQNASEGQDKLLQRLLEDSIRLESQVERTLELARVEGGGPVYSQVLQLKPWLNRFISQWNSNFKDRVKFDASVEDVLIEADPNALQVIFKNILENSMKHSKKDQILMKIQSQNQDQGIVLSLFDDGKGYTGSPQFLGKIFYKGKNSQGTGVGLYLVKALMTKMGGWVSFSHGSRSPVDTSLGVDQAGFGVTLWFREGAASG